jgi:hypothetical protein
MSEVIWLVEFYYKVKIGGFWKVKIKLGLLFRSGYYV